MNEKPKIYVIVTTKYSSGDVIGTALAESGHVLAGHFSSNETWLHHDMGVTSDWKHDKYKEHYPEGYDVIWLGWIGDMEESDLPESYRQALVRNHELHEAREAQS